MTLFERVNRRKPKPDTFHKHSINDKLLGRKPILEEDTGWIIMQRDGTSRRAKPCEVPRRIGGGVRAGDGIDEELAAMLPDESTKPPRKRGGRA